MSGCSGFERIKFQSFNNIDGKELTFKKIIEVENNLQMQNADATKDFLKLFYRLKNNFLTRFAEGGKRKTGELT